ncbi:MAG: serine/threonine-protein kinase, partial [Myxococcota bacterium]
MRRASTAEALAEAERIFGGRYVIDTPLPWNGLAFVFRAVEPGRAVAVAALPVDLSGRPDAEKSFRREAGDLAGLRHSALLPITEIGVERGVPYLEMEFVPGRTLSEVVAQEGPLDRARAFRIADTVLDLLELAHDQRWMHWDLTPANVIVTAEPDGTERVAVVGLGFRTLSEGGGIQPTSASGAQGDRFTAPEVRQGRSDGRSDLYSVGALLHLMVSGGRPPKAGSTARRAGWARPVVERALAVRSLDRFADARSMRAALRKVFEGGTMAPSSRGRARTATAWVLAGALCLSLGGGATYGWLRWKRQAAAADVPTPDVPAEVTPPASEEPSDSGPRSPLEEPLPEPLGEAHARLERGEPLSREELAPLYAYSRAHPDDVRGHLVLAHCFTELGWHSEAIKRYVRAHRADPAVRNDARVLDALLP